MTVLAPARVQSVGSTTRTHARRRGWRYPLIVLAFLAPSAVPLVAFVFYPMVQAAWISLHDWNLISPMKWAGLRNYSDLLSDPQTRVKLASFIPSCRGSGDRGHFPLLAIARVLAASS